MKINIPVSVGELFDKISILEIKKEKISDAEKLIDIKYELSQLRLIVKKKKLNSKKILVQFKLLKTINNKLWVIEDKKRNHESNKNFNKTFIRLARKVYIFNDKRAEIKHKINLLLGSKIREVKSYSEY